MAASQANIELVTIPNSVIPPSCLHGPTLLFERLDQSSKRLRQFYACSAFRDKKECSFHQWVDEKSSNSLTSSLANFSHKRLRKRFQAFKELPRNERHVCCTCGVLLLPGETANHESQGHSVKRKVCLQHLRKPSFLFKPLDNNKTFAQYLFSSKAVDFLLDTIHKLNFTHVLCVGAPRIHEEIQSRKRSGSTSLSSMLLDLDDRYAQMYPPASFAKYNMFNHHFFESSGQRMVEKFLTACSDRVVLITDPPFGGMVEALAQSFVKLSHMWAQACDGVNNNTDMPKGTLIPMMWIFPYFMEARITTHLPSLTMLDYKVDYDNHNLFNNQQNKKGSPVRIFTNIAPSSIYLPQEEGYWFCKQCQRYSSEENQHCRDCGKCPSKDGTTYVHCDACERCVKPSRFHCYKCQMCVLQDHQCGKVLSAGCHICGDSGHKRRECPQRFNSQTSDKQSPKRKQNMPNHQSGKKKKKQ